ncbi:MAG: hypothetical protein AAGB02_03065 [Pseudomonadota bacterium]
MSSLCGGARERTLDERRAYVKARSFYAEVTHALGLNHELGDECPTCGGFTLRSTANELGYFCDNPACGDKGDMIDLVCLKRDCDFVRAIGFLEEAIAGGPKDTHTLDFFAEEARPCRRPRR